MAGQFVDNQVNKVANPAGSFSFLDDFSDESYDGGGDQPRSGRVGSREAFGNLGGGISRSGDGDDGDVGEDAVEHEPPFKPTALLSLPPEIQNQILYHTSLRHNMHMTNQHIAEQASAEMASGGYKAVVDVAVQHCLAVLPWWKPEQDLSHQVPKPSKP